MHIFQSRPQTRKHRHTYQNVSGALRNDDVRRTYNDRVPNNGLQHRALWLVPHCVVIGATHVDCVQPYFGYVGGYRHVGEERGGPPRLITEHNEAHDEAVETEEDVTC